MDYHKEQISFTSNGNQLSGTIYHTTLRNISPGILFLHGAGSATSTRFELWQHYLSTRGYTSFIFDFTGVGKSEGEFGKNTLNHRLQDAQNALTYIQEKAYIDTSNICVIGCSMSGHTAVQLTQGAVSIKGLILAYAAAYSNESQDKPFGPEFTEAIRKKDSWTDSSVFEMLKAYSGKTLLLYGEHDEVIPIEVQKQYISTLKKADIMCKIPHGRHKLLQPTNDQEIQAMNELFTVSADFLDDMFKKTVE